MVKGREPRDWRTAGLGEGRGGQLLRNGTRVIETETKTARSGGGGRQLANGRMLSLVVLEYLQKRFLSIVSNSLWNMETYPWCLITKNCRTTNKSTVCWTCKNRLPVSRGSLKLSILYQPSPPPTLTSRRPMFRGGKRILFERCHLRLKARSVGGHLWNEPLSSSRGTEESTL